MRVTRPNRILLGLAIGSTGTLWPASIWLQFRLHALPLAGALFALGWSFGPCLAVYALVPTARKQSARRAVLFAGGVSILTFSLLGARDIDLEGFVLELLSGAMGAAIGHTLATLIVGPLIFGRFLCGWGCWRAMILELLPIPHSPGRRKGIWRFTPFVGLAAIAFGGGILFFFFRKPATDSEPRIGMMALSGAITIYYAVAVALAFALKDQRAYCKYLCPSALLLRMTSRLSLVKIGTTANKCTACGACARVCPMDINGESFAIADRRIGSSECVLCQRCVQVCPAKALHVSLGFDFSRATQFVPLHTSQQSLG